MRRCSSAASVSARLRSRASWRATAAPLLAPRPRPSAASAVRPLLIMHCYVVSTMPSF